MAPRQKPMTTAGQTKLLEVLVVGDGSVVEDAERQLDPVAHVEHAESLDVAMKALSDSPNHFDLLLTSAESFSALQNVVSANLTVTVLEQIQHGLAVVRPDGNTEWSNMKFKVLPGDIRERVARWCAELSRSFNEASDGFPKSSRMRMSSSNCSTFEITATPIIDPSSRVTHLVAFVSEVGIDRLHDKIDAIDQAGRELLSLDGEQFTRLETQERLSLLEQKIHRCTRDILEFDNFEIRVLDPNNNRLDLVLSSGVPAESVCMELCACPEGSGISGYVAARGRSYICPDVSQDPRYLPGVEAARSSLTVPLFLNERIIGTANFESTRVAAFSEDDRQFAEIFGRYVALALHLLKLLVCERQSTTGQLGRIVMAEITAPVNDILTDIEGLVEDYIGHDDLRHRLRTISENAVKIRDTIKDMVQPKPGVICSRTTSNRTRDPLLEGRRILLADDEDVIRETIRDVLTGYGCQVDTASDGAAAMELIKQQSYDLVLSDIKMPVHSGYEVFAAAKAANPETPVILTTGFGYDPNHCIVRARREGLSAVLFKPFKVDQLLTEIRAALKGALA